MRILIVDEEKMKRVSLAGDLEAQDHQVTACANGAEALNSLEGHQFDVVVGDLCMQGVSGMDLLKRIKSGPYPDTEVVMITAYGSIPVAVEAMRYGAFDFITKPFNNKQLLPILKCIERAKSTARLVLSGKEAVFQEGIDQSLMGNSPPMRRVKELVGICAKTESNVLLCGETGTGKDLIASVIHKNSMRRNAPFVKVSCALFSHDLMASELYGHEKGAFTGAERAKKGCFELAAGGTLYLDDVDDIPYEEQVKLLRVIEERLFERVGGMVSIMADVRIIASTKKDLPEKISNNSFRGDLYYRLNIMHIDVPPLRQRIEDLPQLVRHLLQCISNTERVDIEPRAMGLLASHHWPGNIHELRNTLERAWLTGRGVIKAEHLIHQDLPAMKEQMGKEPGYRESVQKFERELLLQAMQKSGGNKTAAARSLGMKPSTFRDSLNRLGL